MCLMSGCKRISLHPAVQLPVTVYSSYRQPLHITANIKNKEKYFPVEASYTQLCAVALNSSHSMLLIRHPDRRAAFCWHFWHTHTHTRSLTPICTARLTLPDYGNRLSPMCRQEGRFSTKAWKHSPSHKNTHSRAMECQGRHQIVLTRWRHGPSFIPFSQVGFRWWD